MHIVIVAILIILCNMHTIYTDAKWCFIQFWHVFFVFILQNISINHFTEFWFALMPVSRQHFTAYSNFTVQVQRIKSTEMTEIQNWLHFMSFSRLIKSYLFNTTPFLPQRKREREREMLDTRAFATSGWMNVSLAVECGGRLSANFRLLANPLLFSLPLWDNDVFACAFQ